MSRPALSLGRLPWRRALVLAGALWGGVWVTLLPAQPAAPPGDAPTTLRDRRILMLDVGDPNRPAFVQFNEAFLRRLRADSTMRATVFREHLSPPEKIGIGAFYAQTVAFWSARYRATSLDLIIAAGSVEFALATALRTEWGRSIPIIYRGSTSDGPAALARFATTPLTVGLIDPPFVRPAVEDLKRLRPTLRHLLVILQSAGDFPDVQAEVAQADPKLRVTPWFAPSLDALRDSVRRLPSDAAVLYISVFRDGDGRLWTPADFLEAFADASAQPIIGLYRNLVGRGILGGPVIDPRRSGEDLAERALAVLSDPRLAEGRQVDTTSGWAPTYAWSALVRYGIDLRRLPDDAEILGRPIPPWVEHPIAFWTVTLLLLLQTTTIIGLVANRKRLRHAKGDLSALTRRLHLTQEHEHARIARELHDTLAQDLVSQSLDLQRYAPDAAAPNQPPFADRLRHAVTRLEAITHELHPSALQVLDLRGAVHQLVADLRSRSGLEISIIEQGLDRPIPESIRAAVFRIIQEALANIRRHAQATHAAVLLDLTDTTLTVTVRDDGVGFTPAHRTSARLGLLAMRERAAAINGRLAIDSAPDHGTSITLTVSLPTGP
jgi:signal transduction histidine kinase